MGAWDVGMQDNNEAVLICEKYSAGIARAIRQGKGGTALLNRVAGKGHPNSLAVLAVADAILTGGALLPLSTMPLIAQCIGAEVMEAEGWDIRMERLEALSEFGRRYYAQYAKQKGWTTLSRDAINNS